MVVEHLKVVDTLSIASTLPSLKGSSNKQCTYMYIDGYIHIEVEMSIQISLVQICTNELYMCVSIGMNRIASLGNDSCLFMPIQTVR